MNSLWPEKVSYEYISRVTKWNQNLFKKLTLKNFLVISIILAVYTNVNSTNCPKT